MDKADLEEFVRYYNRLPRNGNYDNVIDHLYEKFGREFIHKLPTECTISYWGNRFLAIQGTTWAHSTTEPALYYQGKPVFYILDYQMYIDRWLPLSALDPEEHTLFKLKYG